MGSILTIIGVAVVVVFLPIAMLMAMASLGLFIWSWGRIGRYFVNLGQWLGDWRNFFPLTILGTVHFVVLVVLMRFLLPQLSILWIILLVLHLIVTITCLTFAAIAWTIWFCQWFWPKYRRWLWSVSLSLFGERRGRSKTRAAAVGRRPKPSAGGSGGTEPTSQQRRPQRSSILGSFWALMLGKPRHPPKSAAGAQLAAVNVRPPDEGAPAKRSRFGSFWALMLGRPQPKRQQPRPTKVQTAEQSLGPSGSGDATRGTDSRISETAPSTVPGAEKRTPPKSSWFGTFWALMLGKPQPKRQQARPTRVQTTDQSLGQSESIAATAKTESSIGETAPSTAPRAEKRRPPKRSWFGAFWSLMLGKPSRSGRAKPRPAKVETDEQPPRQPETAAAAMKTGATARVDEAATTPERAKKEKPAKRGFFAGIWTSIVRGVTFVVGLVFLGVVWVVQKMREGIEWIRVRLNLD